jgi:hypothetical protein
MRLVVAGLLRIVAAFCIAIAVLLSGITIIAVALVLLEPSDVAVSLGQMILMWLVFVAFLLAVARLATLAVRQLVDTGTD